MARRHACSVGNGGDGRAGSGQPFPRTATMDPWAYNASWFTNGLAPSYLRKLMSSASAAKASPAYSAIAGSATVCTEVMCESALEREREGGGARWGAERRTDQHERVEQGCLHEVLHEGVGVEVVHGREHDAQQMQSRAPLRHYLVETDMWRRRRGQREGEGIKARAEGSGRGQGRAASYVVF